MAALSKCIRLLPLLLALMAGAEHASAHQLNEYLQATLVDIRPEEIRFDLNLTPGVAVAEPVLALIDRDGDGLISTNEANSYADLLKQDLHAQLDGREIVLNVAAVNFPEPAELRTGWGIIQLEYSAKIDPLTAGAHTLILENRHFPKASVYLFNAALPASAAVQITGQKRNHDQSAGEIAFNYLPPPTHFGMAAFFLLVAAPSAVLFAGVWLPLKKRKIRSL